ncbi:MAG: cytochrome c [Bryobacteraceae bacterium]
MWKRVLVVVGGLAGVFLFGSLAALYLRPVATAPPTAVTVDRSPENVERGRYLFQRHVCVDCHSDVDETRFAYPPKPGGLGKGRTMPEAMGLPGTVSATNLTPDVETGIGNWTDGQVIRGIREGVGHDDRPLFPLMPYTEYASMSDADAQAIVAYLRSLEPVRNPLAPTKINFPVNLLVKSIPKPVGSVPEPNRGDPVAYGQYLTKTMGCQFCHTPVSRGEMDVERLFGGGQEFTLAPGARSVSANISQDPDTGIGKWSEQEFLEKFAQYRDYAVNGSPVVEPSRNTVMPWLALANTEEGDLRAIFAYLKTTKPVKQAVVTHPDAPEEKQLQEKQQK